MEVLPFDKVNWHSIQKGLLFPSIEDKAIPFDDTFVRTVHRVAIEVGQGRAVPSTILLFNARWRSRTKLAAARQAILSSRRMMLSGRRCGQATWTCSRRAPSGIRHEAQRALITTSRTSSITNSFVQAIIPSIPATATVAASFFNSAVLLAGFRVMCTSLRN